MKTYKQILIIFLLLSYSKLSAQEIPNLSNNDFIKAEEIGKKAGWMKISLDSNFQMASNPDAISYEYYEFINLKGNYNSTYTFKLPFPKNVGRIEYGGDKLLSGKVSFFDKKDNLILQYVFKEGFYLKTTDWKNSLPNTLIEYIPTRNSVELYANYFDTTGKIKSFSHEVNDGASFKTISTQKIISPITN